MKHKPFASVAIILRKVGNNLEILLLSRKKKPFGYGLPGGKQEPGECIYQTLLREVKEETNLTVNKSELIGEAESKTGRTIYIFDAIVLNFDTLKISSEHNYYAWIPIENLKSVNLAGNTYKFIKKLIKSKQYVIEEL